MPAACQLTSKLAPQALRPRPAWLDGLLVALLLLGQVAFPAGGRAQEEATPAEDPEAPVPDPEETPPPAEALPEDGGLGTPPEDPEDAEDADSDTPPPVAPPPIGPGTPRGVPPGPQPRAGAPTGRLAPRPGEGVPPGAQPPTPGGERTILPESPDLKGELIDISPGEIDVLDFLSFLSTFTGLPVIVDSTNPQLQQAKIRIVSEMTQVGSDIVIALLQANRFLVTRKILPGGEEILNVESQQGAAAVDVEPNPTAIIKVSEGVVSTVPGELENLLENVRADEIATMVFTLKYTQPADAIQSLNSLVGGQKGAAARSRAFSIVDVKNSMLVIITAKFGLLNYLQKLLSIIDVPIKEPERIIQIIDIENADAEEMVQLIQTFLQGRSGAGGGRLGAPRTGGPGVPGQPGQAVGALGRSSTDYQTNLIADWRTQKIIVETYSERDLEDIYMLIRELDARFDIRRLKTRIYQVRYLKADEVSADLQILIGGSQGFSGQRALGGTGAGARQARTRGGVPRVGAGRQPGTLGGPTAGVPGAQQGGQNAPVPALIVPHIQTYSLIIQAEPEEYAEILNILEQIDIKRRQVFLEAALVEVTTGSTLNYTIELLAGEPNDRATRALFESSFGLSGLDFENFNRTIPDLAAPGSVPPGALLAVMSRGKFPALVRFFKTNTDTQVLATPFILADDNQQNIIDILETRYVQTTATVNTTTQSSQQGEDAGITLEITPTISSQSAVFLELFLEVSQFQGGGTAEVLPPKTTNTVTSAVTIPDGEIFVIGGLTRENKAKTVSKVPILGDIPLIGKLFRSESTSQSTSNLYVFLRAHVLTHPDFEDGKELTRNARGFVEDFAPGLEPVRFPRPNVTAPPPPPVDPQGQERIYRGSSRHTEGYEAPRGPYEPRSASHFPEDTYEGDPERPDGGGERGGSPAGRRPAVRGLAPETSPAAPQEEPAGGLDAPPERGADVVAPPSREDAAERNRRALEGTGMEPDTAGDSWLVPLRARRR
ncbi:MAG TPA: hypothetical protein VMT52_05875 [Planctomycetota bacterium]|nr:hypothetical protein [Planctomycetota bacterium]